MRGKWWTQKARRRPESEKDNKKVPKYSQVKKEKRVEVIRKVVKREKCVTKKKGGRGVLIGGDPFLGWRDDVFRNHQTQTKGKLHKMANVRYSRPDHEQPGLNPVIEQWEESQTYGQRQPGKKTGEGKAFCKTRQSSIG